MYIMVLSILPLFLMLYKTIVQYLHNYYSNVVQKSKQGMKTIAHLFTMLQEKNITESVQLLLERGAEIEARNKINCTPLHYAAEKNSTESVQLLLDRGAEIEAKNENNHAPLHYAAWKNITESVKLLLERGADIEARDLNNHTPLHFAARGNSTRAAQLLVKRGAKIEARDNNNQTPLNLALSNTGNTKVTTHLLMEYALNTS